MRAAQEPPCLRAAQGSSGRGSLFQRTVLVLAFVLIWAFSWSLDVPKVTLGRAINLLVTSLGVSFSFLRMRCGFGLGPDLALFSGSKNLAQP